MLKIKKDNLNHQLNSDDSQRTLAVDNLPKSTTDSLFSYRAYDARGRVVRGEISASTAILAKARLRKQGLSDIKISSSTMRWQPPRSIPRQHILLALQTLATLLKSSVVLTKALSIAASTTQHPKLANTLKQIKTDIEQGSSFYQAIAKHREFDKITLALIDAGEKSGQLDTMLERAAQHAQLQAIRRSQLAKALRYPALVMAVAWIVSAILLLKIVPSFAVTFDGIDTPLPAITVWVLALSDWLRASFWWLIGMLVISALMFGWLYKTHPSLRLWCAAAMLRLPVIGAVIQAVGSARFAQTLALTFASGVPLAQSVLLAGKACDHPLFEQASQHIAAAITTGSSLGAAMAKTRLFSPMSVQMVTVGEEAGRLTQMLDEVATHHDKQVQQTTDALIGLLEPAIILVMGVLIGGLVLAMYLPIFNLGMGG